MQTQVDNIQHIVEIALGQKISIQPNTKDLLLVDNITSNDELSVIRHYLAHQHLVNDQLVADLVGKQLSRYTLVVEPNLPAVNRWDDYLHKLEILLERVKYRREHNFEFHTIMPTQQQLYQLQQECLLLTEQWYGAGKGNLSCFYQYFIAMSQAAGVTRFTYNQIGKFISADHYLALINREQRHAAYEAHEKFYRDYTQQGGFSPHGRSAIDATSISNIFYYKTAQLLFIHQFAKQMVVQALELENFGQLPYAKRAQLWHLLQEHYPDNSVADEHNIFYKYVTYLNARPGEYFNYFAADLPEANQVAPRMLHDIMKIAGLVSNRLVLLSRNVVDNFVAKRHLDLQWQRQYRLTQVNDLKNTITVRPALCIELPRILPNELPYAPGHGLSLCGDGLITRAEQSDSVQFEWNTPHDQKVEFNNWARDIEKLFREFKLFCPDIKIKQALLGEKVISMYLNTMAYSTIHTTQHTHIFCAPLERFLLYMLPATATQDLPQLQAKVEVVRLDSDEDAFYLRFIFADLDNEPLIQFLMDLSEKMFQYFGGTRNLDIHLQLCIDASGDYVFIFEPHAFLTPVENDRFSNPHNEIITARRPLFLQPEGQDIQQLNENHEMSGGLAYCKKFFAETACPGAFKFVKQFIDQIQQSHS